MGSVGSCYSTVLVSYGDGGTHTPTCDVTLLMVPIFFSFCVAGRFFDHYAHLGGAAFGALYYMYGMRAWDAMRVHTLK